MRAGCPIVNKITTFLVISHKNIILALFSFLMMRFFFFSMKFFIISFFIFAKVSTNIKMPFSKTYKMYKAMSKYPFFCRFKPNYFMHLAIADPVETDA